MKNSKESHKVYFEPADWIVICMMTLSVLIAFCLGSDISEQESQEVSQITTSTTEIGPFSLEIIEDIQETVRVDELDIDPLTNCQHEQPPLYLDLPNMPNNMFTCEPFQVQSTNENGEQIFVSAFNPKSDQYRLQQICYTNEMGIRTYELNGERYFTVAMATAYGVEIGLAYEVQLKNGYLFNVVMGDFKHPIDNGVNPLDYGDLTINYDNQETMNVLEFIVDLDIVNLQTKRTGTLSYHEIFGGLHGDGGNIERITSKGKVWNNVKDSEFG